jgi:hypothetical protein
MRKVLWCVAFVGMMCVSLPTMAQGFQKGNWALTLSGGGASTKDLEDSTFTLNVAPSYFLTDGIELGVRQVATYADGFSGATTPFVDFNFNLDNKALVPFIGANVGYSYGHDVNDSWRAGPEAGVKYFVNPTTYIEGLVAYEFDLNEGIDEGAFLYTLGIGFKW